MKDSIFTKIIKGEIPSHKVYEDAYTFVCMDIHPIQAGHLLVLPKAQIGKVWDMDEENYLALMKTVQKVGRRLREVLPQKKHVGVIIEGLDVEDHAHIKVFPFDNDDEFRFKPDLTTEPDHKALAELAAKLRMEDEL